MITRTSLLNPSFQLKLLDTLLIAAESGKPQRVYNAQNMPVLTITKTDHTLLTKTPDGRDITEIVEQVLGVKLCTLL